MKAQILRKLDELNGGKLSDAIEFEQVLSHDDFVSRYNAFHGSMLGLSHTLLQTAVFRPRHKSRKVAKLYFVGQDTHPGIGMPMVAISGEIVANLIIKDHER